MSRRSDSNLIVLIILALSALVVGIFKLIGTIFSGFKLKSQPVQRPIISYRDNYKLQREERWNKEREEREKKQEVEEQRLVSLKEKFSQVSEKDIIFDNNIKDSDKEFLLEEVYKYSYSEASELLGTAQKETKKAKLRKAKKDISRKAFELYGGIPTDDKRTSIPDEIKQYVWQRDKGQCAKCGNNENLEFDHIIPFSKGGSNAARNIQILCQNCNRLKNNRGTAPYRCDSMYGNFN